MNGKNLIPWIVAVMTLVAADDATAAIRLRAVVTPIVLGESLTVYLRLDNGGDSPAHAVTAAVEVQGVVRRAHLADRIAGGEGASSVFSFTLNGASGTFPLICEVFYRDDEALHYSLVVANYFPGREKPAALELSFGPPEERPSEILLLTGTAGREDTLVISNRSERAKDARLRFVVPENLALDPSETGLTVPAQGSAALSFRVENRFFNPGSTSRFYAVAEYDEDGAAATVLASRIVTVVEEENLFRRYSALFVVMAAVILAIVAVLNLARGKGA